MPFASTELVARIEAADCSLLREAIDAVRRQRPDDVVFALPVAGGIATCVGAGSPLDKIAGLGFAGAVDEAELARVEAAYFEHGLPLQVELATHADPSVGPLLTARGYRLVGFEDVLGHDLADLPSRPTPDVMVRTIDADEFATWMRVLVDGFLVPDTQGVASHAEFPRDVLERAIGDLASADGFVYSLAERAGEIAGGGCMRFSDGLGQLCGAATLPAHRRHGVQTALLQARLADARARGCDLVTVTTQPGSRSQQNVRARGFEILYTRAVLVREPDAGGA